MPTLSATFARLDQRLQLTGFTKQQVAKYIQSLSFRVFGKEDTTNRDTIGRWHWKVIRDWKINDYRSYCTLESGGFSRELPLSLYQIWVLWQIKRLLHLKRNSWNEVSRYVLANIEQFAYTKFELDVDDRELIINTIKELEGYDESNNSNKDQQQEDCSSDTNSTRVYRIKKNEPQSTTARKRRAKSTSRTTAS